jgi:hypothetical protein
MQNPVLGRRLAISTVVAAFMLGVAASPSAAQYRPRPLNDPATGERFHIEADASFWTPTADITFASEGLGIAGDLIDAKRDLGVTDQRFPALGLQLRPARRHHFRFQYLPIEYSGSTRVARDFVFNGIRYGVNVPVNSTLDWKTYRFGYQFDVISRDRGFGGIILEAKYTDVRAELATPFQIEFARQRAPIPALGAIARVYVAPNIAITGEITGLTVPESVSADYNAHYFDLDIYGTLNFTNNVGVKGGYRTLDLGYHINDDTGSFVLKGIYFGAVLRY